MAWQYVAECIAKCVCVTCCAYINMLRSVATWCSALQCVEVCCSVLQCAAVCCNVLQCVDLHRRVLRNVGVRMQGSEDP